MRRTQLSIMRDHFREMSQAQHKPTCPTLTEKEPYWPLWIVAPDLSHMRWNPKPKDWWTPPMCAGCLSDDERELFAALADEIQAYQDAPLPSL